MQKQSNSPTALQDLNTVDDATSSDTNPVATHAKTSDQRGFFTTLFVLVLSAGAVGISIVVSTLGHSEFSWDHTRWMADAGGTLESWVLGAFGVYGTVVIAMVADSSITRNDPRPNTLRELQHRTLLSILALIIGVSSIYTTVLIVWFFVMYDSSNAPTLFVILPLNIVLVALSIAVSSSARPTLTGERRSVGRDRDAAAEATERLAARKAKNPLLITIATWLGATLLSFLPAIGASSATWAFVVANTAVTGTTWYAIALLLALSAWPDPSRSSRWLTIVLGTGLAAVFSIIAVNIGAETGFRGVFSAAVIIAVPVVSALIAPRLAGRWAWLAGRTIGSAAAAWGYKQLQDRIERLDERLNDLKEEAELQKASR